MTMTNPMQPGQTREPDALDMLASNLLAMQSSLTVLGALIYGALANVRELQRARGAPAASDGAGPAPSASALGPMTRAAVDAAGGVVPPGQGGQTVQFVPPPPSPHRFNQRRPAPQLTDEQLAAAEAGERAAGRHPDTVAADAARDAAERDTTPPPADAPPAPLPPDETSHGND